MPTIDIIESFIGKVTLSYIGESELTRAEVLQLVNLTPRSEAEIHLVRGKCRQLPLSVFVL